MLWRGPSRGTADLPYFLLDGGRRWRGVTASRPDQSSDEAGLPQGRQGALGRFRRFVRKPGRAQILLVHGLARDRGRGARHEESRAQGGDAQAGQGRAYRSASSAISTASRSPGARSRRVRPIGRSAGSKGKGRRKRTSGRSPASSSSGRCAGRALAAERSRPRSRTPAPRAPRWSKPIRSIPICRATGSWDSSRRSRKRAFEKSAAPAAGGT